jgi:hypothetical protein
VTSPDDRDAQAQDEWDADTEGTQPDDDIRQEETS